MVIIFYTSLRESTEAANLRYKQYGNPIGLWYDAVFIIQPNTLTGIIFIQIQIGQNSVIGKDVKSCT